MMDVQPGTIVLFIRPTLGTALRTWGLRGLLNWAAGAATAFFQWFVAGPWDGYYEGQHIGIVVRYAGGLRVLEILPGGVRIDYLWSRLRSSPVTTLIPLNERYQPLFDDTRTAQFVHRHFHDRYRWGGLPFAVLAALVGWESPGAEFCSELVMKLLVDLGIVPAELAVLRGNRDALATLQPQGYSPCKVARLPQLKNSAQQTLHFGVAQ